MTQVMALVLVVGAIAALFLWMLRGSLTSERAESRLLKICRGDAGQAARLIEAELSRAPGISRDEAAGRAVQRFERDNR